MSDKKPNVFNTNPQVNQTQNQALFSDYNIAAEEEAANEMRRKTEEQIRLRAESIKNSENISKENEIKRNSQLQERVQYTPQQSVPSPTNYQTQTNTPQTSETSQLSIIDELSQPQMNQAFDVIPLPSEGKLYPSKKKSIKVAFLTTADENILTSPNLVESGEFLEILMNRKILEPELRYKDLHTGDRNAIMIWLRATGYGVKYPIKVLDNNGIPFESEVDLSSLKTVKLGAEPDSEGLFYHKLNLSGDEIKFKLLTTGDVDNIGDLVELDTKNGSILNSEATYILMHQIVEVNGNRDRSFIQNFANNIRSLDAKEFRDYADSIESGIDLNIDIETPGGGSINTFLSFNPNFFWPNSQL